RLLHSEGQRAAGCKLAVHRRVGLSFADRPAYLFEQALDLKLIARLDNALEAGVVDACEESNAPAVLLLGENCDGARLRHRLDDQDARHDGSPREVATEVPLVLPHPLESDDALTGLELEHLVDQQERLAVRQNRLDGGAVEGEGDRPATARFSRVRTPARARWA